MNARNFVLGLAILAMSIGNATAQTQGAGDFFFSFTNGGANQDQEMQFDIGDTGSLYVYWSTNGPADSDLSVGAFIDVFSDNAGVIEFTNAETFDYGIDVGGTPIGNRLLDSMGGGGGTGHAVDISANYVDEMFAFTVTGGPGILESNNCSAAFCDNGYRPSNDGFEWGRIDFHIIGTGITNITGAAGDGMIVNDGEVVDATFTTATVRVGTIIPEPTTAGLLVIGFAGLIARRRR